jgi:hypothetical protein
MTVVFGCSMAQNTRRTLGCWQDHTQAAEGRSRHTAVTSENVLITCTVEVARFLLCFEHCLANVRLCGTAAYRG